MGALEAPQDRHGQDHRTGTSRAEQMTEAMAVQGAQEAMAVQGAQEAMAVQGAQEAMAVQGVQEAMAVQGAQEAIKACAKQLAEVYMDIFNTSLSQESGPCIFKSSIIVPLLKRKKRKKN